MKILEVFHKHEKDFNVTKNSQMSLIHMLSMKSIGNAKYMSNCSNSCIKLAKTKTCTVYKKC